MEKNIPLKIEELSTENDDKHRITSPSEIKSLMHDIAKSEDRVALYYNHGNNHLQTTLLAVDDACLWLKRNQDDANNINITESDELILVGSHFNVKIQFTVNKCEYLMYQGQPALRLPLPNSLYRLQRRDYYRLTAPVVNPLQCVIGTDKKSPITKTQEFTIMDISCGGVGLTCKETGVELTPGKSYANCIIDLPGVGTIRGTIEVRNLVLLTFASGLTQKRAGCQFNNLSEQSIILLQRYVTNMQRMKSKN